MNKLLLPLILLASINVKAQNVGIGTTTPGTKLTVANNGFGLEHSNGTVSIKTNAFGTTAQMGTFSNHPFQLMANNGSGQFVLMPNGLVGIGVANSTPTLAGLTVDAKVGAANAIFGSNTTGIAIESSFPGIGFNSYYNNGRKYIGTGYAGLLSYNPVDGFFSLFSSNASGTANAAATTPAVFTVAPSGFVGIGTTNPNADLDVNGNAFVSGLFKLTSGSLANGSYLAGNVNGYASWSPTSTLAHITTATNSYGFTHTDGIATVGTYLGTPTGSNSLGGWIGTVSNIPLYFFTNGSRTPSMTVNLAGNTGIGSDPNDSYKLTVTSQNTSDNRAVLGEASNSSYTNGKNTGVFGIAFNAGTNYGVYGSAQTSTAATNNYGVYGYAINPVANTNSVGVYGTGSTWAGYFDGNVYSTGTFQTSDERLKINIASYGDEAVGALNKFTVKTYQFRQDGDYAKLNQSTDQQLGIMAADIQRVFPQLVKKAVSQVMDEKTHKPTGKTIEFDAVNYTGLIPVLVKGMQEQQKQINDLKAEIAELKALIKK